MSDAIEVMPMRQTRNLLYDGDGRVVGVWFVPTGRGMFYDCFIVREGAEERTCHVVLNEDESGDTTEAHSCCGDEHTRDPFTGKPFSFCPSCGAKVVTEMPTDDERREVAEKMRDEADGYRELKKKWPGIKNKVDLGDVEAIFQDITHFCGMDGIVELPELFDRLADLIEPEPERTCNNKQIEYNSTSPLEFRNDNLICSSCGETFCADSEGINSPIDWAFCPNCGARVVNG